MVDRAAVVGGLAPWKSAENTGDRAGGRLAGAVDICSRGRFVSLAGQDVVRRASRLNTRQLQKSSALLWRDGFGAASKPYPREIALAMGNLVHHRRFTVEWGHCDPAGIVFNSRFFEFFDWSSWLLFEQALGVRPSELATTFGILGIPLVDAKARFMHPAKFNDVVEIASHVTEFRRSSFDIEHRITIAGELAVEGSETRVWAGRDPADPLKLKALPVPAGIIERFRAQA